jgi:two-component system, NarL family, response regulator LiaR
MRFGAIQAASTITRAAVDQLSLQRRRPETGRGVAARPRVLVCDASEIARLGIAAALKAFDVDAVAVAGHAADALAQLERAAVDVVLVDVTMPDMEQVVRRAVGEGLTVIGMGVEAEPDRPFAALIAGAVGYLTKDQPAEQWADGIRAALRGEAPIPAVMTARLIKAYRDGSGRASADLGRLVPSENRLTRREWEILTRVAEGKTNRAVAAELFISVETVRTHVSSILSKLQTPNRSAAAAKYHALLRAG